MKCIYSTEKFCKMNFSNSIFWLAAQHLQNLDFLIYSFHGIFLNSIFKLLSPGFKTFNTALANVHIEDHSSHCNLVTLKAKSSYFRLNIRTRSVDVLLEAPARRIRIHEHHKKRSSLILPNLGKNDFTSKWQNTYLHFIVMILVQRNSRN